MTGGGLYLDRPADHWAALLGSGDPLDRRLAAHALAEIGPPARTSSAALLVALDDPVPFVRVWAAAALAAVDPSRDEAVAALVAATAADQAFVRSLAAWALGRLGRERGGTPEALAALERLVGDEDPSVRTEAEHARTRVAPRA